MINKRVLQVAIQEINAKTDIEVSYEIEKQGRRVVGINFEMHPKNNHSIGIEQSAEIQKQLINFGVKEEKVNELLQKHGEEYLWANIEIVKEQVAKGKVKNPTGYLLKAFASGYSESQAEHEKILKEQNTEKKKQLAEWEESQKQEKDLELDFEKQRTQKVKKQLSKMEESSIEILKNEFIESTLSDKESFFFKIYHTKGFDNPIILNKWFKYLAEKLLPKNDNDFEEFKAKNNDVVKSITP